MVAEAASQGDDVSVTRLLRMLRLLRVVVKLLRNDAVHAAAGSAGLFRFNPGVARVIQLFMLLICTCHWAGCIWWLVSSIERRKTPQEEWGAWGPTYEMVHDFAFPVQYAHALLWGVGVITGLIPFDVMPTTGVEALVTILFLLFGFSLNIVIVSSATSALQTIDSKQPQRHELEAISRYLVFKNVPSALAGRIVDFFQYQSRSSKSILELTPLKELPPDLSMRLTMELNRKLIRDCPIFHALPSKAVLLLVQALRPVVFVPMYLVLQENHPNTAVYFINRGVVRVWKNFRSKNPEDRTKIATLTNNDFFGEQSLTQNDAAAANSNPGADPRLSNLATATVQCLSYCDMLVLQREHFQVRACPSAPWSTRARAHTPQSWRAGLSARRVRDQPGASMPVPAAPTPSRSASHRTRF